MGTQINHQLKEMVEKLKKKVIEEKEKDAALYAQGVLALQRVEEHEEKLEGYEKMSDFLDSLRIPSWVVCPDPETTYKERQLRDIQLFYLEHAIKEIENNLKYAKQLYNELKKDLNEEEQWLQETREEMRILHQHICNARPRSCLHDPDAEALVAKLTKRFNQYVTEVRERTGIMNSDDFIYSFK